MSRNLLLFIIPIAILIILRVSPFLTLEADIKKEQYLLNNPPSDISPVAIQPTRRVENKKPETEAAVPSQDPAAFGIQATPKEQMPHTQNDWDAHIKATLVETNAIEQMDHINTQLSAKEYQNRLALINERIKEHEKIVRENPSDEAAAKRLQNLYMLKSTLNVLQHPGTKK